jgi:hypothetical protein
MEGGRKITQVQYKESCANPQRRSVGQGKSPIPERGIVAARFQQQPLRGAGIAKNSGIALLPQVPAAEESERRHMHMHKVVLNQRQLLRNMDWRVSIFKW